VRSSAWLARCWCSPDPDSDYAQDMDGLGRAWAWAYLGSSSSRGSETSLSGVKGPGVDAGKSSDSDVGDSERERRLMMKRSVGEKDSDASRSSSSSPYRGSTSIDSCQQSGDRAASLGDVPFDLPNILSTLQTLREDVVGISEFVFRRMGVNGNEREETDGQCLCCYTKF